MRVLGVDPGLTRCGLAVVEADGPHPGAALVAVGVAHGGADRSIPVRLVNIENVVQQWLSEHHPEAVAIEQVFMQRNTSNAVGTAQAMGVVTVAAAKRGLPVVTYTPTQVKAAVTGHGGADKAQVATMVTRVLKLPEAPKPADAADAAAIAICHLWRAARENAAHQASGRSGGLTAAQSAWQQAAATTRTRSWEERIARGSVPAFHQPKR